MANPSYADLTPFGRCVIEHYVSTTTRTNLEETKVFRPDASTEEVNRWLDTQMKSPKMKQQLTTQRDVLLIMGDIGDIFATMQSNDPTTSTGLHPAHVILDDCTLKYRLPHQSSEGLRKAAIRPERAAKFR